MAGKMNLPDDNDRRDITPQQTAAMVMSAFIILLIIVIVLIANRKPSHHQNPPALDPILAENESPVVKPDTPVSSEVKPGDLDFWDMYPTDAGNDEEDDTLQGTADKDDKEEDGEEEVPTEATDGKHTLVVNRDGSEEWVLITPYLPKNDYDYTNLVSQSGRMAYYTDSRVTSYLGVSIDKYDDYVDFGLLRDDGIDYVMVRVGVRGYGTGTITLDDYYTDNISRANQAGLDVGIYFSSQAITPEEAMEEAVALIAVAQENKVTYPLAIDIGFILNDTSRIEGLTKTEKTAIIRTFADTIKEAGFNCVIHADKEFLIKEIDLSKFSDVDIWLDNNGDLPDYPYAFTMWEYASNGSVNGISGPADMSISFIDYTQK
ncbi:MAG: hypothetical protein J6X94_07205 [Lachnospiraceae bacterium]|nr:hypothetical protein [Lachnospiraceae bacterium]